ncbi:hypothetical protein [Streptomyces sp. NPDC057889]
MTTNLVIDAQEKLARCRRLDCIWRAGATVNAATLAGMPPLTGPGRAGTG